MIVVRFRANCPPERLHDALTTLAGRIVQGVIHYDVGRDVTNPDTIIVTAVLPDQDELDREAPPELGQLKALFADFPGEPPEATIFDLAPARPQQRVTGSSPVALQGISATVYAHLNQRGTAPNPGQATDS
jgi:hypothetical protein